MRGRARLERCLRVLRADPADFLRLRESHSSLLYLPAGRHRIDPDPMRTELKSEHPGHLDNTGFGRGVVHALTAAVKVASMGSDIDDTAAFLRDHEAGGLLRGEKCSLEVGREHQIPF